MPSSSESIVSKIKRNTGILEDLENAKVLRVAYKTKKGWKRLRLPKGVMEGLRRAATSQVEERLNKLVPDAVSTAVDKAIESLMSDLNN